MDSPKNLKEAMGAAFRAGWAAACLTIADECRRAGGADIAGHFAAMANQPPPVEIGDLSTPEGQAMAKQPREVVMVEQLGTKRGGPRG